MPRYDLTAVEPTQRARALWPLFAALGGVLAAWPLYLSLLDLPFIRSTAWPMFAVTGIGAVAGFLYARWDDRLWVRLLGGANIVGVIAAAGWFFWLASFPRPDPKAETLAQAPNFELKDHNGRSVSLKDLRRNGPVLLVFYRGSWCPFCISELRGLSTIERELKRAGVRVIAISVDDAGRSRQAAERLGLRFPLLSDVDYTVIGAYGVVYEGGGPQGSDTAIPAHFLIDEGGQVLWRRISGRLQDRASPAELLDVIDTHVTRAQSS